MQKVAWPITIVQNESAIPPARKNEFSAIPVMIPGSASGSRITSETSSRPKKRKRCTANAAAEPSRSAIAVAIRPARIESQSASRISVLCQAADHQRVEKCSIGQLCTFESLNA